MKYKIFSEIGQFFKDEISLQTIFLKWVAFVFIGLINYNRIKTISSAFTDMKVRVIYNIKLSKTDKLYNYIMFQNSI